MSDKDQKRYDRYKLYDIVIVVMHLVIVLSLIFFERLL